MHGLKQDATAVPDLLIEDQRVVLVSAGSLVEFTVHNRSARTAAAVVVEGRLAGSAGQEMPVSATIDYVPAGSRVRAGLIFPGDVQGQKVEIRPVAFRQP